MDIYLSGGIHFVSTRILVLDMLKKKIPIEKITGIILLRAHKILESCQEAFVLRLYRQSNKVILEAINNKIINKLYFNFQTGFIKAFSNSPQSFTMGFGHVERIMRNIFVKELYLWPRFQSLIVNNFKRNEVNLMLLVIISIWPNLYW